MIGSYTLKVLPIELDWAKQPTADIVLEPPTVSSLRIEELGRFVVKVDPSTELFLDAFDIITASPIGPFLKLEQ
jgi:hypothetical protein